MTEYWVSQGNKWCDICKIYIANNPLSIRTHELGTRHKDNVDKRLASIRKDNATKEKELKEAARALQQIEDKAKRSYQKDLENFQDTRESNAQVFQARETGSDTAKCSVASSDGSNEWEYDSASGYYYNRANGYHYDPNSGLYYSSVLGKWITQEAFTSQVSSESKQKEPVSMKPSTSSVAEPVAEDKGATKLKSGPPPGLVAAASPNPMRSVKGAPSSISVNKRKRDEKKPKVISKEEAAALKAREAAKKRMEEREKPLLGLYKSY